MISVGHSINYHSLNENFSSFCFHFSSLFCVQTLTGRTYFMNAPYIFFVYSRVDYEEFRGLVFFSGRSRDNVRGVKGI